MHKIRIGIIMLTAAVAAAVISGSFLIKESQAAASHLSGNKRIIIVDAGHGGLTNTIKV